MGVWLSERGSHRRSKHKDDATRPPTSGDDVSKGYGRGSLWTDTTTGYVYQCVSADKGAAKWLRISISEGDSGREVELSARDGFIKWRYVGDDEWIGLVAIEDLKGEKGDKGEDGEEVEIRSSEGFIQWRRGDDEWTNLVAIEDLKGEKGDKGEDGEEVEIRSSEGFIQWRLGEGDWDNLVAIEDLKGEKGDKGQPGLIPIYNHFGLVDSPSPKLWVGVAQSNGDGIFTVDWSSAGFEDVFHVDCTAYSVEDDARDRVFATMSEFDKDGATGYTLRGRVIVSLLVGGAPTIRSAPNANVTVIAWGI